MKPKKRNGSRDKLVKMEKDKRATWPPDHVPFIPDYDRLIVGHNVQLCDCPQCERERKT